MMNYAVRVSVLAVALSLVAGTALGGRQATIGIDGDFSDWLAEDQLDVAPNWVEPGGDMVEAFPGLPDPDTIDIWMAHDADYLYISALFTGPVNVNGEVIYFFDADMDALTGWAGGAPGELNDWMQVTTLAGAEKAVLIEMAGWGDLYGNFEGPDQWTWGPGGDRSWVWGGDNGELTLDTDIAYGTDTVTDDRMELRVPRDWLGRTDEGDQLRFFMYSLENVTWTAFDLTPDDISQDVYLYTFEAPEPEPTPEPRVLTMDGDFSDWWANDQIDLAPNAVEETGDRSDWSMNPSAEEFQDPNIVDIWMAHDDAYLYISVLCSVSIDPSLAEYAPTEQLFFLDADMNPTTGYAGSLTMNAFMSPTDLAGAEKAVLHDASGSFGNVYGHFTDPAQDGWGWSWGGDDGEMVLGEDIAFGQHDVPGDRMELRVSRTWMDVAQEGDQLRFFMYLQDTAPWTGHWDLAPDDISQDVYLYTFEVRLPPEPTPTPGQGDAGAIAWECYE